MPSQDVDQAKHAIRERVWTELEHAGAVASPGIARGKIPNFLGAERAADRLARLPEWLAARVVKAVPDKAQMQVRTRALADGKLLYMAAPRLAQLRPFYVLDPAVLTVPPARAAVSSVAATIARSVGIDELMQVDLVVCGSVAVNLYGIRLGKGAGYSDIEVALLHEAGLLSDQTVIVTTVHELQVLEEDLPESDHDFRVDLIVTPEEVIPCAPRRRLQGLIWEDLSAEKIAAIPVLAEMAQRLGVQSD